MTGPAATAPGQAAAVAAFAAYHGITNDIAGAWNAQSTRSRVNWVMAAEAGHAAIAAAAAAQPAPDKLTAEVARAEFAEWMAGAGYDDSNSFDGDHMAEAYEAGFARSDALRAAYGEPPAFPAAQAALARVLSWFAAEGTRREASVTRAQLAHAYQDGGLGVPDELEKFL